MTQDVLFDSEMIRSAYSPKGELATRMGRSLKAAREARGLSQVQLANAVDVTQSSIVRFEQGLMVPRPYLQTLIAATLLRPVSDVFHTPSLQEMYDTYSINEAA